MPQPEPISPKPFRPQFTLRRMLVLILLLGIVLGIGRWVYVTVVVPRQIVAELRSLGAEIQYAKASRFVPNQRWSPGDPPPIGYSVHSVYLKLPFQSDDDAARANQLLRQLPPLRIVRLDSSRLANPREPLYNRLQTANRHVGIAMREVQTTVLVHRLLLPGEQVAAYCRDAEQLRSVDLQSRGISIRDLREICLAKQLEELSLPDDEWSDGHLEVLEAALHLKRLRIGGVMPFDRLRTGLGSKANCELDLSPFWIGDQDLKESVATLPNLSVLSLEHHEPSDEAVAALADVPKLRVLDLTDATVSDAAVMALARSNSLETVDLCGTNASDEAILKLADCPTLRLLHLHFDRAKGLPSLSKKVQVDWVHRRSFNLDRVRAWRRAFVEKKIVASPEGSTSPNPE